MNKIIEKIATILVAAMLVIGLPIIGGWCDTHYTMEATVDSVSKSGTIFIDKTNNVWAVDNRNYKVGQKVKIRFNTSCTDDTRVDDTIEKITVIK